MNAKARPTLSTLARRYLAHRRKLGFLLRIEGPQIEEFARYADRIAPHQSMTTALALQWATLPQTPHRALYHAKRLECLRGFARFCAVFDPRTEIPATRLVGPAHRRRAPHIYSDEQIRLLLRRAASLPIVYLTDPLRPFTYVTLFGLIACTGIRLGEALRLTTADFDKEAATLRVPRAKFSPDRILPLHSSTVAALRRYLAQRKRHPAFTDRLFVARGGRALCQRTVHGAFWALTTGFIATGDRARPRIHDLRHTLATRLIAKWSQQRSPIGHHLLLLCRYLGHRSFQETFWYVSANPHALTRVSQQFNSYRNDTHEPDPIPVPHPTIFRGTLDGPSQRQPANRRCLPRYLPPVARLSLRLPSVPH
jgi:integrase